MDGLKSEAKSLTTDADNVYPLDELLAADRAADEVNSNVDDELEEELEHQLGKHRSRKRKKLHCFHCHRYEGHFLSSENRWYYSFLLGLTFGLVRIVGPFQCQCCGQRRLMTADRLNIRYLFRDRGTPTKTKSRTPKSRG